MQTCIKDKLAYICERKGLKLKDFHSVTNLPYRTAQSYLSGSRTPNAYGLQAICTHLRVNLNWLLADLGDPFLDDITTEQPANVLPANVLKEASGTNYDLGIKDKESALVEAYRLSNPTGREVIEKTSLEMAKLAAMERAFASSNTK